MPKNNRTNNIVEIEGQKRHQAATKLADALLTALESDSSAGVKSALYHRDRLLAAIQGDDKDAVSEILKTIDFANDILDNIQNILAGRASEHTLYFYLCDIEAADVHIVRYLNQLGREHNAVFPPVHDSDFAGIEISDFHKQFAKWVHQTRSLYGRIQKSLGRRNFTVCGELGHQLTLLQFGIVFWKVWIDHNMPTQGYRL